MLGATRAIKVTDVEVARRIACMYLKNLYGRALKGVRFTKIWLSMYGEHGMWEIEGKVVLKRGPFKSEAKEFRLQIDPCTGRILGLEGPEV